jgi:hypothetical protein
MIPAENREREDRKTPIHLRNGQSAIVSMERFHTELQNKGYRKKKMD